MKNYHLFSILAINFVFWHLQRKKIVIHLTLKYYKTTVVFAYCIGPEQSGISMQRYPSIV